MSNYYSGENYEMTNSSLEMNDILADLPLELIKENIFAQIRDPMSTSVNYVDIIIDKYNMYRTDFAGDADVVSMLDTQIDDFFSVIIDRISDEYNLGLDIDWISESGDIVDIGESLYVFFVLRYAKNVTTFVTNYIEGHRKSLYDMFFDANKKDVSTLAYKKYIKNKEDLVIITNLPAIIKYIMDLDEDPYSFVESCASDDNYEASVVLDLIENGHLVGDFSAEYLAASVDDYDYILDELQSEIKSRLIKRAGLLKAE